MKTKYIIFIALFFTLSSLASAKTVGDVEDILNGLSDGEVSVPSTKNEEGFLASFAKASMTSKEMKMVNFGDVLGKKLAQKQMESAQKVSAAKKAEAKAVTEERKAFFNDMIENKQYRALADMIKAKALTGHEVSYVLDASAKKNGTGLVSIGTNMLTEAVLQVYSRINSVYQKAFDMHRKINSPRVGM